MRDAVWATFCHYSSTKDKPQHHLCSQASDSWCEWQQAKANGSLDTYEQSYNALPDEVLDAIRPIYEDPRVEINLVDLTQDLVAR